MAAEIPILPFTQQLEDAGWLGVAAGSALLLFNLPGTGPGTLTSTDQGFVWTKSLLDSTTEREFDFGIGKLKMQGAGIAATLGVQMKDGYPSYIDLMISFLGEGTAPAVFLEVNTNDVVLADKIVQEPTVDPPPEEEAVIGYENPGDPLRIFLPTGAIEFNFRLDADKNIFSSLQLYGGAAGVLQAVNGIIEVDLDRVVVFKKLNNTGLYVDRLFIDWTSSGTTSFAGLFPEVYDPGWKGFGAANITFLFPVDEEKKEFIAAGVQGFLYGFDKKFSASFNFNYTSPALEEGEDESKRKWIRYLNAEIEIRNNEFLRAEAHMGFDLKRALEKVDPNATDTASIDTSGTEAEKNLKDRANVNLDEKRPAIEIGGVIDARIDFVWHNFNGDEILGFDIIMSGVTIDDDGTPSGLVFQGNVAKMLYWLSGIAFGVYTLRSGIDNDSTFKKIAGVSLLLIVLADMVDATWEGTPVLPQLNSITIQKLGFRYVRINKESGEVENYYQVILGWRLNFKIESLLIKFFEFLASKLLGTPLGFAGDLFGESLDKIQVKGEIDIEMDNLILGKGQLPPEINALFEQRDIFIRAKKLPELFFIEKPGSNSTAPMGGIEIVTRPLDETGTQQQYGIAFKLEGFGSADATFQFPAAGFVIFFYPEFEFAFLPMLAVLPKLTFVIPKLFFAEATIDMRRPLPSFGGEQNRIRLDVAAKYKSNESGMKEYLKPENYKYKFNGEMAWGTVVSNAGPAPYEYGFLFIQLHFESSTPLFVVGCVGVYGLGGLFGKNIAPGVQGSDNNAMGIANWIIGQRDNDVEDEEIFKNVRHWPEVPAADGSTWHPAIHYDAGSQSFDDMYTVGLTLKVGSANDEGETYKGEAIVMIGVPQFWIATGAIITFKKINSELIVIVVYDRDSLAVKIVFELKVDEEGSFVKGIIPLEFGHTFSSPKKTWLYIGHYLDAKGGPVLFSFLKGLLTVKGYLDIDSEGLLQFGIVPVGEFPRPDITGTAIGLGVLAQYGPKRFGPSSVNITLFGALGANVAKGTDPAITFGEVYLGGYIQLKVLFVKAKLELLLALSGMTIDEGYRYMGLFMVRLNMPWPIPDWKYAKDFVIQSSDFLPLPDPVVASTAAGLHRMQPRAVELNPEVTQVLPIDAVIAFTFDQPIYGIAGEEDTTGLLLNDEDPSNDKISTILETDYQGLKYLVHFTNVIESISIFKRQLGSELGIFLPEIPATWEAPAIFGGGAPDEDAERHHTLFLNALMPPHLQFAGEQMGEFNSWVENRTHVFPCQYPGLYCINRDPRPVVESAPIPTLHFDTPYGDVEIRDDGTTEAEEGDDAYSGLLGWTSSSPFFITLPYKVHYDVPFPDRVHLRFSLVNTKPDESRGKLKNLLSELKVEFTVKLRGKAPVHFNLSLEPDNSTTCGWASSINQLVTDASILTVSLTNNACSGTDHVFVIEIIAADPLHTIDFIKSRGPIPVYSPGLMGQSSFDGIAMVDSLLRPFELLLSNLCIEDTHHSSLQWGLTIVGGTDDANPVDTLTNHMLFEPNSEYILTVNLRSFVATYHIGVDGTELVDEHDVVISLPPVKFHTEQDPSQPVSEYVGFTYPAENMRAPYPGSLTPMLTLKYQGLISKIYKKHYGTDALVPLLVDTNEQEVQPVLKEVIELNSGGADQALEDLLEHCIEEAQDYTHLEVSIWERTLATNTKYSLQLRDVHITGEPKVPYTISFHTSRFQGLPEHVQYCNDLFTTAATESLLNPDTFNTDMRQFIETIGSGVQPGFDDAIESFYLNFLGIEGGKLSPSPEQDLAAFIAGTDTTGNPVTWSIALELTEPVVGKEGVSTSFMNAFPTDTGLYISSNGEMLMRDRSGSRLLLFRRDAAGDLLPLSGTVTLPLSFDPRAALRDSIAAYVRKVFTDKDASEQQVLANDQFNELLTFPGVSEAMTTAVANLNLNIP